MVYWLPYTQYTPGGGVPNYAPTCGQERKVIAICPANGTTGSLNWLPYGMQLAETASHSHPICHKVCHVCRTEISQAAIAMRIWFQHRVLLHNVYAEHYKQCCRKLHSIFLMGMLQTRKQFSNTWKYFHQQVPFLARKLRKIRATRVTTWRSQC